MQSKSNNERSYEDKWHDILSLIQTNKTLTKQEIEWFESLQILNIHNWNYENLMRHIKSFKEVFDSWLVFTDRAEKSGFRSFLETLTIILTKINALRDITTEKYGTNIKGNISINNINNKTQAAKYILYYLKQNITVYLRSEKNIPENFRTQVDTWLEKRENKTNQQIQSTGDDLTDTLWQQ